MKLWKKIIRLLGLGAWPQTNPSSVELNVHPLRGADLRVGSKDFPRVTIKKQCKHDWCNVVDVCIDRPCTGSVLGRKCIKCGDFDGAYNG